MVIELDFQAMIDANGDGVGLYNIFQYALVDGEYKYERVGTWENSQSVRKKNFLRISDKFHYDHFLDCHLICPK